MNNDDGAGGHEAAGDSASLPESKATHLPGSAQSTRELQVEFTGTRGALFRIVLRNTVLGFLTLGIYRFWAKTRLRRYFWHSIRLGNEPLEYSGLPMELFIGMLIAMAVLVPLGFAYDAIYTAMLGASDNTLYALDAVYYLVILGLIHFAVLRVWRYRLSRTIWRGIHFHLQGQAWRYAFYAMVWTVGTIVSLGIAYPWMRIALFRYRFECMHFGDKVFSFSASAKPLILPWLARFLVPIVILGIGAALFYDDLIETLELNQEIAKAEGEDNTGKLAREMFESFPLTFLLVFVSSVLSGSLLSIWYRVRETRVIASGMSFGSMQFVSAIRFRRVCLIWLKVVLVFSVLSCFFFALPFAGVFIFNEPSKVEQATTIIVLFVMAFLVFGGFSMIMTLIARYELTRHFCETLSISYAEDLEETLQGISGAPKHAEGFADALDVGAL